MNSDRRDLYQEEFALLNTMTRRLEETDQQNGCTDALRTLTAAYGKLLNDTLKLNRVADRQYAWLIDSQDRLKSSNEDLQRVSSADMLTGLFNRHKMDRILREELVLLSRSGTPASLVLIDIDHFKRINDTWGHNAGDEVLVGFAQALKSRVRSTDRCARWGGDEFLLLLPNTSASAAVRITEHLRRAVADGLIPDRPFTISLGVAEFAEGMELGDWLALADQCLYWAKREGRNRTGHPHLLS